MAENGVNIVANHVSKTILLMTSSVIFCLSDRWKRGDIMTYALVS